MDKETADAKKEFQTEQEKEEAKQEPDFLQQVKAEREALEKVRDENKKLVVELQNLRAREIISGKADAGQAPVKEKDLDPIEYSKAWREGKISAKLPGT